MVVLKVDFRISTISNLYLKKHDFVTITTPIFCENSILDKLGTFLATFSKNT